MPGKINSQIIDLLKIRPIQRVFKKLKRKNICFDQINALEIFGKDGEVVNFYPANLKSIEIWEIDPQYSEILKTNFPKAIVKITDSFQEIYNTPRKYNLIIIDNPMSNYGNEDQYCEHFLLFPQIINICDNEAVLIMNTIPRFNPYAQKKYPYLFNDKQLKCRNNFYQTKDPAFISNKDLANRYIALFREHGYNTEWFFYINRNFFWKKTQFIKYLVIKVSKKTNL